MSRFSINQVTTLRWSFEEDLNSFRELGIDAVGLWSPKVNEVGEEKAIELIRDSGLSVSSLSSAGGFTGSDGTSFFDSVDDARRTLRLAGQLGADCLNLVSGARGGHIGSHARPLLVHAVEALADEANEQGVMLALQPMPALFGESTSFLESLDETLEVIEQSGRGVARIAFDVYHLWQEPGLLDRIPEIAPYVGVIQLSDWRSRPRSEFDRCLLGDGRIPLTAITNAFDEAGYCGYYEIRILSEELWQSDYSELLRECQARFDVLCRRQVPLQIAPQS